MDFLQSAGSKKVLIWLAIVALGLLIVSLAFLFFGQPSFTEKDVVFTLEGPDQALSGDEATYTLKYQNNTGLELKNLRFRFFYPSDSVVIKDGAVSSDTSEGFEMEELGPGESGERQFKAFLIGDKGNIKEARATLIFNAGNLSSSFEKSTSLSTPIVNLPIALTLLAPPSAISGQEVNYILEYRNQTAADISDLLFEFRYPEGFNFQRATPAPSSGNNTFTVAALKQGAGSRITATGTLTGNERESKQVMVILKRKINGQYVDYVRADSSTVISSPLLGLEMLVNNASDYNAVIGDLLEYTIRYRNNSNQGLIGLTLAVKLEGEMYDLGTLEPNGGFFDGGSSVITWNASGVPDFANLTPGKQGTIKFRIRIKPGFPAGGLGSRSFFVKATAALSTPNVPSGLGADEVSTTTSLTTKISTQPKLDQVLYYSDPAFGSSGPMPPEVGKETAFTVHWQLTNPGNDMNSVKVTATLGSGVVWKNVVSAGTNQPQPTFNANRSEVSWNLGVLPQGVGVQTPKYEASFQIAVTPGVNQKGDSVELLKETLFSGIDSFTKQNLVIRVRQATSNQTVDRPGEGNVK